MTTQHLFVALICLAGVAFLLLLSTLPWKNESRMFTVFAILDVLGIALIVYLN